MYNSPPHFVLSVSISWMAEILYKPYKYVLINHFDVPPHFVLVVSIVDGEGFVALEFRKVDKGVVVDVALVENGIHLFP